MAAMGTSSVLAKLVEGFSLRTVAAVSSVEERSVDKWLVLTKDPRMSSPHVWKSD